MNELSASLDRLQSALGTLETAVEHRLAAAMAAGADGDDVAVEAVVEARAAAEATIARLQTERDQLAEELNLVRSEAAALEEVSEQVAGRLDGAIAGIKEVLEG